MDTPTHRSAREPVSLADGWLQVVSTHHKSPWEDVDRKREGLELVLFDMDGTLVHGSAWERLHEAFGVSNEANWQAYQRGAIDDHQFIRSDIALWQGRDVHVSEIEEVLRHAPVMDGAREVVDGLRRLGIATCILSGGLDILARRVCEEVGVDMYVANGIRLRDTGHVHGEGIVWVEIHDKGKMAREIRRKLGVPRERTASVGNSAYDVPMFRETGFGIAFNPSDDIVRRRASRVVEGTDMRPVLRHLLEAGAPDA
ncbi:MAG: phosphoserine phosphatase [Thermoplasmata archaeon]|nr:phosphoserine phosphatase [Thermoplasmata archaeon]